MAEEFTGEGGFEERWGELVAKAWEDDAFKKRLLADPAAVLKENGLVVPAGITLKVMENTDKAIHLVLPVKPGAEELSEEELHRVAGGHCGRHGCRGCGHGCGGCRHHCRGCRGCGGCWWACE